MDDCTHKARGQHPLARNYQDVDTEIMIEHWRAPTIDLEQYFHDQDMTHDRFFHVDTMSPGQEMTEVTLFVDDTM
eukprot:14564973-Heterocapsa_arctica.AAC.1